MCSVQTATYVSGPDILAWTILTIRLKLNCLVVQFQLVIYCPHADTRIGLPHPALSYHLQRELDTILGERVV